MKTRIEFKGYVDVYDEEPVSEKDAKGWVWHALERGDKHASHHSSWLGEVLSVSLIEDED